MFFCVLAAHGLDRILPGQARYKPVAMAAALAGCAMILAGIWVTHSAAGGPDNSFWGELLHRTSTPVDSTLPWNLHRDANFLNQSAAYAGHQLIAAAVPLLIAAALIAMLGASSRLRWCGPLIGLLIVGQSLSYAWGFRDATPWHGYQVPVQWAGVLPRIGDRRVVISNELGNLAQFLGLDSVWDYEVFTLARYQRLLNEGHTGDPVLLTGANEPKDPRLLQLLRCAWVLPASGQPREIADPLPHVLILDRCQVETDPASAIQAVRSPGFDPHSLVVLEKPPEPAPRIGASGGWAMIVRSNINEMEIVAELPQPGILLVTDSFGQGWHVRAVEENASQHDYQVMPADFALRARFRWRRGVIISSYFTCQLDSRSGAGRRWPGWRYTAYYGGASLEKCGGPRTQRRIVRRHHRAGGGVRSLNNICKRSARPGVCERSISRLERITCQRGSEAAEAKFAPCCTRSRSAASDRHRSRMCRNCSSRVFSALVIGGSVLQEKNSFARNEIGPNV